MVKLHNLRKVYRGKNGNDVLALDGISLEVGAGEFVSVQGPSGSGKTTLLLAAGGLLVPDEGAVSIEGTNMYSLSSDERAHFRAKTIGFVFQQFHLVPYLDILDNILVPSLALPNAEAKVRAEKLIEQFKLSHRIHHVPAELSTGERQRTALARALLNKPTLIFADEPTGNLDHENARIVLGYLADFAKTGGAVLLMTHDDRAGSYAHRSLKLEDGKVIG